VQRTAKEKEEDMSFDNLNRLADEMAIAETRPLDPDFLALGLGGTSMMAMIWTVAMGYRAVGVEMRGDPFLGVRWNIRKDLYHQFGAIDQMMFDRYGEDGVPRCQDGRNFSLADCLYTARTKAGDIIPNESVDGFTPGEHIAGTISHIEHIDDLWKNGKPNRHITSLPCAVPSSRPDVTRTCKDMKTVLNRPPTFQVEARSVLILLRRYLEAIEKIDTGRDNESASSNITVSSLTKLVSSEWSVLGPRILQDRQSSVGPVQRIFRRSSVGLGPTFSPKPLGWLGSARLGLDRHISA
jgi:hypothetical protein